jgi:uncharacterized CHY-type Zn-finger protein
MMRRVKDVVCAWCKKEFSTKDYTSCPLCKDMYQCVSCGAPTKNTWCNFCLEEE